MPITAAHQWQESLNWVSVDVKIPNVTSSLADIVTTPCYVKINCAPYFFEADLFDDVDVEKSKACVGQNVVNFFLVKKKEVLWERLNISGDRQTRLARRQRSLQTIREQREKLRKDYPGKFSIIGRLAVGEHLKIDEMKRKLIETRKDAERLREDENIESWKLGLEHLPNLEKSFDKIQDTSLSEDEILLGAHNSSIEGRLIKDTKTESPHKRDTSDDGMVSKVGHNVLQDLGTFKNMRGLGGEANDKLLENHSTKRFESRMQDDVVEGNLEQTSDNSLTQSNTFSNHEGSSSLGLSSDKANSSSTTNWKAVPSKEGGLRYSGLTLPAPRNSSKVDVAFSAKPDLPKHLPARESREREVKLKKSGKQCENALDVSERAPIFLQDKGDKFFKGGDYQSAINAYTDALTKDPTLVVSFANRAACKLHLKEYQSCIEDCTKALCILTKGTSDSIQENILAQTFLNPPQISNSSDSQANQASTRLANENSQTTFSVDGLELLSCLSGQGCCCMNGLTIEGAGVEEWKVDMKKHMFIRRGTARYHMNNLLKARDDFAKVSQIEPNNKEINQILASIDSELATNSPLVPYFENE